MPTFHSINSNLLEHFLAVGQGSPCYKTKPDTYSAFFKSFPSTMYWTNNGRHKTNKTQSMSFNSRFDNLNIRVRKENKHRENVGIELRKLRPQEN